MLEIALGIGLFTSIILLLVLVILFARSRLVRTGPVHIEIDGHTDRCFEANAGDVLLETLKEGEIFLPSACGGNGICGQCRVKVLQGGGEILPSEEDFFSKREQTDGYHLACQLMVKQDLKLELPQDVFGAGKWQCEVISNNNVATFIKELVLKLPEGETMDFEPGSYVQIEAPPHTVKFTDFDIADTYRMDWDVQELWRLKSELNKPLVRAYTMANYPGEAGGIKFNIRIALPPWGSKGIPPGKMTSYLFDLKPGDAVTVSGPFGDFFPRHTDAEMIYIGGGSGMAPMRSHIFYLLTQQKTKRKISYWYGARSLRELFYQKDFDALQQQYENFDWHVVMSDPQPEDHWQGDTGYAHEVLFDKYLKEHPAPEECEYYLCGPPQMLDAVQKMLKDLGVEEDNIMFDDFCA